MRRPLVWVAAAALAAGALAGGLWFGVAQRQQSPEAGAAAGLARTAFKDFDGADVTLARWRGKVTVVNFWATWCPPCREEIPGLVDVQAKQSANGAQIVGIAVDSVEKTRDFVKTFGVSYPVVVGGMETIDLMRTLGNKAGALPFTVILDREGRVAKTHLGLMSVEQVEAAIRAAGG